MSVYDVQPIDHPLNARVQVPGSKSLTNRAFVTAALARGESTLRGVLLSDDTRYMMDALRSLGVPVLLDEASCVAKVNGHAGHWPNTEADLFCGNAGTVMRFLTAACAVGGGRYQLDGIERMRQRPIGDLIAALRDLGASVGYSDKDGYPPVEIVNSSLRGGTVRFTSPPSSQMVSAILIAAPNARADVMIDIAGDVVSQPYLAMTLSVMEAFGVSAITEDYRKFIVPAPQYYQPTVYAIEPDASNATYFLAASAIAGGSVTVEGLGSNSVQGDVGFADVLERMGCTVQRTADAITVSRQVATAPLQGIDVDLNAMPDTAQTLAVVALFAQGVTTIRNVANLRVKETDRLTALHNELTKLGAKVTMQEDSLAIEPPRQLQPAAIDTYDDHRMAMSFSLAGLKSPGVHINDPACVNKTFPDYFQRFEAMQQA